MKRFLCVAAVVMGACGDSTTSAPDAPPTPGSLVVDVASDAQTTERGGMATFTVHLDTAPTADVVVPVVSADPGEGTVSPATLTFTPASWSTPQTVTVIGVDDTDRDGLVAYQVDLGAATSNDAAFAGVTGSAMLANADDDAPGVTVSAASGATAEDGTTATFTVVLDAVPQADVTVGVTTSSDEVALDTAALVFTQTNWQTPQTVTLTGLDDDVADGDQAVAIALALTGTDAGYTALTLPDVALTNTDDDQAGVIVSSVAGNTTEAGGTTTFTVVLTSEPLAPVTVTPLSNQATEGVVSPGSATFAPGDWNVPQTFTVTGQDEHVDDGDITFQVQTTVASSDGTYDNVAAAPINVINEDDDTANIIVSASGATTSEAGDAVTLTLALASEPTAPVTVHLASSNPAEGALDASSVTFDATDWDLPQTLTVTGQDDGVLDGVVAYQVVFSATESTDATYAAILPASIALTNLPRALEFACTGAPQPYTVPAGITALVVTLDGAQGGANWENNTNFGGRVTATLAVTPGEELGIYVGCQATSITGGWNGGGNGENAGRGGGGASDVRRGGSDLTNRVLVAGAGGGAGYWSSLHVVGGVGGATGGDGYRDPDFTSNPGGRGATQTGPGANGTCVSFDNPSTAGALGVGGAPSGCGCEGYGGGGGYYGGAGSGNCRGGGGGSSFADPATTSDVTMESGVVHGDGTITISLPLP